MGSVRLEIDYRYFFLNYEKAVILSDLQSGKIIEVNENAVSLFGKTIEGFNNLKRTDILPLKTIKSLSNQLKAPAKTATEEAFIIGTDGNKINIIVNSTLIGEGDNKYLIDTLTIKEKTEKEVYLYEHEKVEKLIKESEVKYRTLFETANDAIFVLNDSVIIEVNSRALEIFNGSKEDIIGKKPEDLSPEYQPDGKKSTDKGNEKKEKTLAEGSQFFEWKHKKIDGSLFDAEVSLNTLTLDNEVFILSIVRDITQRKRAEQALIQSRRSLSNLLKNLPGIAYRCKNDKDRTMEFISEGCFAFTSYHPDQLINNRDLSFANLILEEDRDVTWEKIQKSLNDKEPFKINYRIKTAGNKVKWVWEQGIGIYSEKTGDLLFIEGLINDITEQKLTEEALQQSEAKFRSLVEESLVGVYIIQDGKLPYVNPRVAEIFGYSLEEILGRDVESFIYQEDLKKVRENLSKRISGQVKTVHYFTRGIKKDKSLIEIEVMGSYTLFNGKPAVIGTLLDVTEKNKSERAIRRLSRAVEQSPASIIITDTEGNIEYVNPRFTELTGYTYEEVIGKNPKILKYGDTPQIYYKKLWDTIKSGEEWRGEFLNRKKNGELFWEFGSISPIKDSDGKITNFLAIKEDVTERKNNEETLRIAKEKAEEMNSLKSVFLANMSHELRTPMVAVLGYSEILKREIDNPELQDMAKEIYESSHRLLTTLNLVLDLSRIESNRGIINYTELDVVSIVTEEFDLYRYLALKKNIYFKTSIPDEPVITLLDERMLRQIINCLVSNAVKFTNTGGISLNIFKEDIGSGKQFVIIKVRDTGIGIPKNSQDAIFEAFRQMSEGLNRSFEGTGLGLTVAKKFVEMMQGEISVESEFGKGSTFTLIFPIIRKFELQQTYTDPSQLQIEFPGSIPENRSHKLLLVEDDQSNAGVIRFFLADLYEVDLALTGDEGINMAKKIKYEAILMDINLGSGMSGLEAAQKIKQIPGYVGTPIIAVTALAMRGDKEKFLAEGCTHYISKPFKKDDLIQLINKAVKQAKEHV